MPKLEAVVLSPSQDEVQPMERIRMRSSAEVPAILGSWPLSVDLGEGLLMYAAEDGAVNPQTYNALASKLVLLCSGVDCRIYGKVVFLGTQNSQEVSVPAWVEIVLKNTLYVDIVFVSNKPTL